MADNDIANPSIPDNAFQIDEEQLKRLLNDPQLMHSQPGSTAQIPNGQMPSLQGQQDPIQTLLAQLHDVKTPDPIGLWPLAAGWWILIVLIISIIMGSIHFLRKKHIREKYKRLALKELRAIETQRKEKPQREIIVNLLSLLKKTSLTGQRETRSQISRLHGSEFLILLACSIKSKSDFTAIGDKVDRSLYSNEDQTALDEKDMYQLFEFAKKWINQCDSKVLTKILFNRQNNYQQESAHATV